MLDVPNSTLSFPMIKNALHILILTTKLKQKTTKVDIIDESSMLQILKKTKKERNLFHEERNKMVRG